MTPTMWGVIIGCLVLLVVVIYYFYSKSSAPLTQTPPAGSNTTTDNSPTTKTTTKVTTPPAVFNPGIPHTIINKLLPGEYFSVTNGLASPDGLSIIAIGKNSVYVSWNSGASADTFISNVVGAQYAMMTSGGDFVITDINGNMLWHTNTTVAGSHLRFQNDRNLIIVTPSNTAAWATGVDYTLVTGVYV